MSPSCQGESRTAEDELPISIMAQSEGRILTTALFTPKGFDMLTAKSEPRREQRFLNVLCKLTGRDVLGSALRDGHAAGRWVHRSLSPLACRHSKHNGGFSRAPPLEGTEYMSANMRRPAGTLLLLTRWP